LPNGNFLICSGRFGYSFEITPDDEIVWEYKTPLVAGQPASQGDTLEINNNLTFRLNRIPLDYPAFDGRDLTPKGWIELNPDSTLCDLILPTMDIAAPYGLKLFPNPTTGAATIEWDFVGAVDLEVYDHLGRLREIMKGMGGRKYCMFDNYEAGIYFIRINGVETRKFVIH